MPHRKLFVLGDSISIRYGPWLERMTRGLFEYARKSGVEEALKNLDNAIGANGGNSRQVLDYLRALEREGRWKPDVLLLNCGLHDIRCPGTTQKTQVPPEEYRANLQEIVALTRRVGVPKLVWVCTTHVEDERHNSHLLNFQRFAKDLVEYNHIAEDVMNSLHVPAIDLCGFTQSLEGDLFEDHVHFTDRVCELQAAFIAGYLSALPR